jgi:hypothetical protein
MTVELKKILLVEDNPNDVELTLEALAEHNLANSVDWHGMVKRRSIIYIDGGNSRPGRREIRW